MERLLLRDRAGPDGGWPGSILAAGDSPAARGALMAGSPHDDVAAAAAEAEAAPAAAPAAATAATSVGRSRMRSTEKDSPVRSPAPKDVKAVRNNPAHSVSLLSLVQNVDTRGPPAPDRDRL